MTLIQKVELKFGLVTRGKWTLEHDVSQDVYIIYILVQIYIYIYIYIIAKVKFPKSYTIVNALYIPEFYYILYISLKLYMLRMTQNYILRKYSLYDI